LPRRDELPTEMVTDGYHGFASPPAPRDRRSVPVGRASPPIGAAWTPGFVASHARSPGA